MFSPAMHPLGQSNLIVGGGKCVWKCIVRNMAKGSPGQSQGKPSGLNRNWRLRVTAWTAVRERQIIATQRDMNYHPGLNAGIDPRNNCIYAICDGTLIISTEKIAPNMSHPIAEKFYMDRKGQNIHKRFINVVPREQGIVFKLVDLV